jgi:TonB family protein
MHSAEQKQQIARLRAQRIIGVTLGVSLLFHGVLWGIMRQIPAPEFARETVLEVTLAPQKKRVQAKPTPKTALKSATKPATRRIAQAKQRPRLQAKRQRRALTKRALARSLRRVRLAASPRTGRNIKHNIRSPQNYSETAKTPQQNSEPNQSSSTRLNPLRSSVSAPRPDAIESSNVNLKALRVAGRGISASNTSTRSNHGNEIASLPQGPTFSETSGQRSGKRSGKRRSGDTQLYLPDMGSTGNTSSSGESSPTTLRPRLGSNNGNERTGNSSLDSGNRLARGSEKSIPLPISRPAKKLHPTDSSPRTEEAGEAVTGNNDSRRPRWARRQNRAEEPDLFPTPTPRPLPERKPEPEPKTEPELFHPARARSQPKPDYPEDARANKQEGLVVMRLQINANGRVTDASLITSSGVASLDKAALKGVLRWRYEPARRGQTPVASSLTQPLRWRLTD